MRLEDISDTLGHRSVMVTAEIYRHPITLIREGCRFPSPHREALNDNLSRSADRDRRREYPCDPLSMAFENCPVMANRTATGG